MFHSTRRLCHTAEGTGHVLALKSHAVLSTYVTPCIFLPAYRTATERSNKQILTPLSWLDIAVVAVLTGFSEEILFRGAIIPASFIDW